jgi:ATP-dependent helicase HrpB
MTDYPVLEIVPALKSALVGSTRVILQAPPGAGKSTVLPQQLLNEPWLHNKKIIMLEPRRLAARSVALRIADLLEEKAGETAGYRVRFDTCVGKNTRIEVVTEGILTRMIQSDNSLDEVGLLIFDEFHERSLQADLALALSLQVQSVLREDIRILIMSATLDTGNLSESLGQAPVITSAGRQFPVAIRYAPREADTPIAGRVATAIQKVLREDSGDILAFLPGTGEIKKTAQLLDDASISAIVYPLYGDLPFRQQQEAILPRTDGLRKVVLATSIAETSLTIEGVKTVVDGGLSRVPRFDPRSGLTRLDTVRVSVDAADQRAGRAGRLGPGVCYRLWDEGTHRSLLARRKPEILEADLASLVLELAQWGIKDIQDLHWITPPPAGAVSQAMELLQQLGALNDGAITPRGKEMVKLPTHPRMAHLLLEATGALEKSIACDVASILEERDPLGREAGADLSLRVEVLRRWRSGERVAADRSTLERIERLAASWRSLLQVAIDNTPPPHYLVGRLTVAAYPERIARQQSKQSTAYGLANGRTAKLPDHDPLAHETWICATQLDAGQREGKIFLAAPVDPEDLDQLSRQTNAIRWDGEREMVVAFQETRVGDLVLRSTPVHRLPEDGKNRVLCEVIRDNGLRMLGWSDACQALQARMLSVHRWRPDENWPNVTDEHLLNTLESWLVPFLGNHYKRSELEKLDLPAMLKSALPWSHQSKLDLLAPDRCEVPSGSAIHIQYFADGAAPIMEVRLQEMFGLLETPTVNEGRTKIILHLLSPGYKPVQVTQDLHSFWQTTYHEVRSELRRRYPRHSWPEDPWTAQAVRGVPGRKH